jgi:hypothetical protein
MNAADFIEGDPRVAESGDLARDGEIADRAPPVTRSIIELQRREEIGSRSGGGNQLGLAAGTDQQNSVHRRLLYRDWRALLDRPGLDWGYE